MTTNERTIELFSRTGSYIIASSTPRKIGELLPPLPGEEKAIPLLVTKQGTAEEFNRQREVLLQFHDYGRTAQENIFDGYPYFYHTVAAD